MINSFCPRKVLLNHDEKPFINLSVCENIRIAQWNIYAQGFVISDGFQYCSWKDLQIDNRIKMFRKELAYINADIYCLQEADIHSTIFDILNESMSKYEEIFCPKAKSPCQLYAGNVGPDGCCIIYNKERLECIGHFKLCLESTGSYVTLFAIFRFKSNPKLSFIVVCTHLKSKKQFEEVRLMQSKLLLAKLDELMKVWNINSVIVCGDFNANGQEKVIKEMENPPFHFTNVYNYLRTGTETEEFYTTWVFKKEESLTNRIRQRSSVYVTQNSVTGGEQSDAIDYIWYTSERCQNVQIDSSLRTILWPLSIEDVPRKEDVGLYGIPSPNMYPSDHLSLIADFTIGPCSV